MQKSFAELLDGLTPDPWRTTTGFSPDMHAAQEKLFATGADEAERRQLLADWLQKHQPCLFGRIAARQGLLSYCIVTEDDLTGGEQALRDKIQKSRRDWTAAGYAGKTSGFILLLVSPRIAHAQPNETVKEIALRLCSHYLLEHDAVPDQVLHDEMWLEKPGPERTTWKWLAGVNYFCAHGDGRWWADHRIPGGMAFSTNSVGHMAKSGQLARGLAALDQALGIDTVDPNTKVESLGAALRLAMQTIHNAASTTSGKATELFILPGDGSSPCPINLPATLAGKDFSRYRGFYHTDYTIPSEYFRPDVTRPESTAEHVLDFTYLFDNSLENPAYVTMGAGRPVRIDGLEQPDPPPLLLKRARMEPTLVDIGACPRLLEALGGL